MCAKKRENLIQKCLVHKNLLLRRYWTGTFNWTIRKLDPLHLLELWDWAKRLLLAWALEKDLTKPTSQNNLP